MHHYAQMNKINAKMFKSNYDCSQDNSSYQNSHKNYPMYESNASIILARNLPEYSKIHQYTFGNMPLSSKCTMHFRWSFIFSIYGLYFLPGSNFAPFEERCKYQFPTSLNISKKVPLVGFLRIWRWLGLINDLHQKECKNHRTRKNIRPINLIRTVIGIEKFQSPSIPLHPHLKRFSHDKKQHSLRDSLNVWEILQNEHRVKGHQCLRLSYIPWEILSNIKIFCRRSQPTTKSSARQSTNLNIILIIRPAPADIWVALFQKKFNLFQKATL